MRFRTNLAAALIGAAILPTIAAKAQDVPAAIQLLQSAYRQYQHGGKGIDFTDPKASAYYHSSLLALIREDIKADGPDNVPAIDFEPLCGCQDWNGIWDLKIDVKLENPQKATADLSFSLDAPKGRNKDSLRKLVITLVPEHGQWRIYDIVDESDPKNTFAIRKLLADDIKSIRSSEGAKSGH